MVAALQRFLQGETLSVQILTGDCLDVLKTLPDQSVHTCVTSPPYDGLRTYGGFTWDFESIALQLFRVLCDGGVLCWNVGDQVIDGSETLTSARQAIYFKDTAGFRVHDTMIYERLNFSSPEHIRYHQLFEYVFILSKGRPRCFNPIKDKQNANAGMPGTFGDVSTIRKPDGTMKPIGKGRERIIQQFGMRGNVWRGPTAGQENVCQSLPHPAMMPRWLARDLIASWSNPGDTILDPFGGSGTTGLEADRLQRDAILIDINPEYAQMARERISGDSPLFAEVA